MFDPLVFEFLSDILNTLVNIACSDTNLFPAIPYYSFHNIITYSFESHIWKSYKIFVNFSLILKEKRYLS